LVFVEKKESLASGAIQEREQCLECSKALLTEGMPLLKTTALVTLEKKTRANPRRVLISPLEDIFDLRGEVSH
jgi:hypothetical protein